jgi:hypothetical protein
VENRYQNVPLKWVNLLRYAAVRVQKAYTFALSNVQSIGMMGFMMYMSGTAGLGATFDARYYCASKHGSAADSRNMVSMQPI